MALPSQLTLKTDIEHLLFKRFEEERTERRKLERVVTDLKGQIDELQSHLKQLRDQSVLAPEKASNYERHLADTQYETDEEDLARETEWVRQKSRKKRKLNTSLPSPQGVDSHEAIKEKPKIKKQPLPPPIVVENVKDYQKFYDLLSTNTIKDSFLVKMMSGESVKINAYNEETYRCITKLLLQNNLLWYSYENKQDRPIRVMAKNLHSSCLPGRIIEDLTLHGYKIQDAVNKLSWRNKEPLNMFMLSFQKDEDINKVYNIRSILGCKVDIQPVKTTKLIPQCKKCQAYGHTQKYCSKEPRCVKCTGKHLTRDCTKPAEAKPKCVHCGEPHPANYRGCMVAKELQTIKNKLIKKNSTTPVIQIQSANKAQKSSTHHNVTKNISYAQVTKGAQVKPQPQPQLANLNIDEKINRMLNLMTSFDERLKKLETGTKTASSKFQK